MLSTWMNWEQVHQIDVCPLGQLVFFLTISMYWSVEVFEDLKICRIGSVKKLLKIGCIINYWIDELKNWSIEVLKNWILEEVKSCRIEVS